MKKKNSKFAVSIMLVCITAALTVMLAASCKKDSAAIEPAKNNLAEAATMLNGNLLSSNVAIQSNSDEIGISYNGGDKLILLQKLQGAGTVDINTIHTAGIITTGHGVIIKDMDSKKVYLLPNNDAESIQAFQAVESLFGNNYQSTTISGITIVNAEKS